MLSQHILCIAQTSTQLNGSARPNILKVDFDILIDSCISKLQDNRISEISDSEHIQIMLCINTIFMDSYYRQGGKYLKLLELEKEYVMYLTKVYPDWSINRGMGFYIPKLKMELGGTPAPWNKFEIVD